MKDKKGEIGVGSIIVLFVVIIVGIALLVPIFNTQSLMTSKQTGDNQSVDVAAAHINPTTIDTTVNFTIYGQSDWKVTSCPLESVIIRNGVGTTLVVNTDYILDANNGRYSLLNTAPTQPGTSLNQTYVDYSYCADGYIKEGGGRTAATLIGLFMALALLAFVLDRSGVLDLKLGN